MAACTTSSVNQKTHNSRIQSGGYPLGPPSYEWEYRLYTLDKLRHQYPGAVLRFSHHSLVVVRLPRIVVREKGGKTKDAVSGKQLFEGGTNTDLRGQDSPSTVSNYEGTTSSMQATTNLEP